MVTGRSFVYFDRVRTFLLACSAAAGAAELPEALRAALRGLSFEVRLAYYRFCEDDYQRARAARCEEPVRREVHRDPARRPGAVISRAARRSRPARPGPALT